VSALAWLDHLLSLDEWDALPGDSRYRLEVVEGVLLVSPRPMPFHQRAVTRLGYLIDAQLPPELCALSEVDVLLTECPLTVRAPDVIITATALVDTNPTRFQPRQVLLAIEVLSEGSVRIDRIMKLADYADAGIAHYWIVDLDPPISMTIHRLVEGSYEVSGKHTGTATVELDGSPITLDLDALTTRRAQKL